jgi:hypothetical protein
VLTLAVALAMGLWAAARAQAAPNLTFTLTPQGGDGRISYAGGNTPVVGTDLQVSAVSGLGTPSHPNGALAIDGGKLSFSTGTNTVMTQGASGEWTFNNGGRIELDGAIATLGIPAGTKLLTGNFTNATTIKALGSGDLKIQGGVFFNVVDPTLAAYYGLPTGGTLYLGGLSTLFTAPTGPTGAFNSSGLTSGSVTTEPVPEPGTLAVFAALATGGIALLHRRRAGA